MRGVQQRFIDHHMIIKVVCHGPMLTAIKWSGFMQTKVRGPGSLELALEKMKERRFSLF